MLIEKISQLTGVVATVIDNLTSTSSLDALSARQGKILNDTMLGTTLYTGSTHVTSITLPKPITDFKRIKLWALSSDSHSVTLELLLTNLNSSNNLVGSLISGSNADAYYMKFGRVVLNNKTVTLDREYALTISGNTHTSTKSNTYTITKIVGFDY